MVAKQTLLKFFAALGFMLITLVSCKKEAPTLAKISIRDTDGAALSNAEVHIFGEPTSDPHNAVIMDRLLYSDSEGEVIFDFTQDFKLGQAGLAVLNIEVSSNDGLLFGEGIIKIEEEKINTETLIIQPL